jgi:hypothetical protein
MGDSVNRRGFLKAMSGAGVMSVFPEAVLGLHPADSSNVIHEVAAPRQDADKTPKYSIRFSVCGISHDHIYGMVGAVLHGGGVLVAAYGAEPDKAVAFAKAFPQAKMVHSEEEILNDASTQLVLSSTIPNRRAPLGVEVMKRGKDFLSDKPGATTLDQVAEVRKTIAETNLRDYVQRTAGGEGRSESRRVGNGRCDRTRDPDNQYRSASDFPAGKEWVRSARRRSIPAPGLVLGAGVIRRNSVRYRITSGGPISLLHGFDRGGGGGFADCKCKPSRASEVSGFRRHDPARGSRDGICKAGLVYAGRVGNLG